MLTDANRFSKKVWNKWKKKFRDKNLSFLNIVNQI